MQCSFLSTFGIVFLMLLLFRLFSSLKFNNKALDLNPLSSNVYVIFEVLNGDDCFLVVAQIVYSVCDIPSNSDSNCRYYLN